MTLTELLPSVKQLPFPEKIKLIRLLAEDLEITEDIYPLEPNKAYYIATPQTAAGAAEILWNALKADTKAIE